MSLTLLKHEIRNHLSYVIQWDRVDPDSYTNVNSDDTDAESELWEKCVQYLDREHQPPPPKRPSEPNIPRLRGPSRWLTLQPTDHKKLIQYFKRFSITVDQSDSDTEPERPVRLRPTNSNSIDGITVNLRKIPTRVISWGGCQTQDELIARPVPQKHHRNHTRDASFVLFRHSNDSGNITGQHPAPQLTANTQGPLQPKCIYHFGQLLRLISLEFAGHMHALAYITQFKTETEDPGLQRRCSPYAAGTKVVIVRVEDIMELCGVLHKVDGSQYFCANGTAIHHFNESDSNG